MQEIQLLTRVAVHYCPVCSVCASVAGNKIAACGADVKSDVMLRAFNDLPLFTNLTAKGTLLRFPGNPAINSTPYVQQCSNLTVV